jgi:hypothetical protein
MTSSRDKVVVLTRDIDGLKTLLGLFTMGTVGPEVCEVETYSSGEAPDLESIVERLYEARTVARERHPSRRPTQAEAIGEAGAAHHRTRLTLFGKSLFAPLMAWRH